MTQMRKDVLTGRWVIVADPGPISPAEFHFKRVVRDSTFCPFCETNEALTPPEVFAIRPDGAPKNGPGWTVRVVPSTPPRLRIEGELGRRGEGIHDLMNGVGAHEIIVETPRHDKALHELAPEQIAEVARAWSERIIDLERDPRMRSVLVFKNYGEDAGAHTISHSISQLVAVPITPRAIKSKLTVARDYFAQKERCLYCDVLQQELGDGRRVVVENAEFVALTPFASRAPFEMLILPKSHQSAFSHITAPQLRALGEVLQGALQRLESTLGEPPYNLFLQDRPFLRPRKGYWETIEADFHWHLEILPQITHMTGFEWGSWFFYNAVPPETAARCLAQQRCS
jgi:UDPglucose--hexose-1-phosphate uridylyltransferase